MSGYLPLKDDFWRELISPGGYQSIHAVSKNNALNWYDRVTGLVFPDVVITNFDEVIQWG